MVATIGYIVLYALGGTLRAATWTFFIGIAGAPGAFLAYKLAPHESWHHGSVGKGSIIGLLVCVIGQVYVALAFAALGIGLVRTLLANRPDLIGWIFWVVAFVISGLPALFAAKEAASKAEKKTQDVASVITLVLAEIGFFIFVLFPSLMRVGWAWMPYV